MELSKIYILNMGEIIMPNVTLKDFKVGLAEWESKGIANLFDDNWKTGIYNQKLLYIQITVVKYLQWYEKIISAMTFNVLHNNHLSCHCYSMQRYYGNGFAKVGFILSLSKAGIVSINRKLYFVLYSYRKRLVLLNKRDGIEYRLEKKQIDGPVLIIIDFFGFDYYQTIACYYFLIFRSLSKFFISILAIFSSLYEFTELYIYEIYSEKKKSC